MNKILETLYKDEYLYLYSNCFGEDFKREEIYIDLVCDQCGQHNSLVDEGLFSEFVKQSLMEEMSTLLYEFAEENKYSLLITENNQLSINREKIKQVIPQILLDKAFLEEDAILSVSIYGEDSYIELRKLPLTLIVDTLREIMNSYVKVEYD